VAREAGRMMANLIDGGENIGLREYLIDYIETVLVPLFVPTCPGFVDTLAELKAVGE
jgi:hypothetical protein